MDHLNYSEFRKNLAKTLDKVNDDHVPVLITRQGGKPAVVMSLEDFNSYAETDYLLSSPKNREQLLKSIDQIKQGKFVEKDLIEE